ncbi:hypothetical protein CPA40_08270 [Bifidobacterium callitrichos]|uniref:Carbon starvation protein n=1 Tax=Bifidobacterium callitrichos TaxID=762209 RepID=A0A2T3G8Y3_9BIFI|nr:hypothetical protein [Bifidobacterium callitrichos]PST45956.1 hypothetical protein CPA40_08270 [Bifidobacterium callitrichos]
MKLNKQSTARLYALTCVACVVWLVQSLMEANADGSLTNWATIIFSLCLLVVIGWTGYNAISGWNAKEDDEDDGANGDGKNGDAGRRR